MDVWLIDGFECDPLEWWKEFRALWNSAEVKAFLKSKDSGKTQPAVRSFMKSIAWWTSCD